MNQQRSYVKTVAGKQKTSPGGLAICMAVAVGFEPTESFHPHTLSRRAP